MAVLFSFKTDRFDVTKETPNEFNAFAGEELLKWLRTELAKHQYASTEPDTEDWGWYIDVTGPNASYLVGATAEVEYKPLEEEGAPLSYDVAADAVLDWTVQVHKHRTLVHKLFGKNKMEADDALCSILECTLKGEPSLQEVSVERNAV
jgi:hypothetical protein